MQPDTYSLLIVDDAEMNRDVLCRRLQRAEYRLSTAANGKEALELLRTDPDRFDLVLLDIMMPEMNGFAVLSAVKSDPALRHIPVIVISALEEMASIVKCIELGAEDYLPKPFNATLLQARVATSLERKRLRDHERAALRRIESEKKRADDLLNYVIPVGIGLSAERDFDQLLEVMLIKAMDLSNADGGTLYLTTAPDKLAFMIVRNKSLNIQMGGPSGKPITFAPLPLVDPSGQPNHRNIATHVVVSRQTINIADAYQATQEFDFSGTRAFDQQTGYRTTSVLAIPLKSPDGAVLGVLQLINALSPETGKPVPFEPAVQQMIDSLALLAAAALSASLREKQLRQEIEALRIEINEGRKQRQVEEITESEYFQSLKGKVQKLRERGKSEH
jgi:CheY-like chemotaxis protein